MTPTVTTALDYTLLEGDVSNRWRVLLNGIITYERGCALLERLWDDPPYTAATSALWDVGNCELPEFNELLNIAKYINKHKNDRGPRIVAFVSPAFASSALARAFRGFDRVISLDLNFFGNAKDANAWLDKRTSEK